MGKYVTFLFCIMSFQSVFAQTKVVIPAAKDNTIYEYYDTDQQYFRSNGIGDYFFAGVNGAEGGSRIVRGLIQFDLQKYIPDGVEVLDVTLNLNMNQTNSGPQAVSIYPLLQDWGEGASDAPIGEGLGAQAQSGDATWLHTFYNPRIPDDPNTLWTEKGGDFNQTASASVIVDQPAVYSWSSTESMINDVQTWAKDPASNFGWIIRGDESGQLTAKRFISRSNPDGNGPELIVTYDYPNSSPVAVNDTTETTEDQSVQISVSKNDYDTDGTIDISSIAVSKNPVHGKTEINNEIVTYTPESDYYGTDSFEYTIKDNDGATSNSAMVIITIAPVNDAPVTADIPNQTINEGSSFTTINLDTYVSDVDNADSEMTWTYSGNTSLGVSIVNRVATITTPNADWNGAETITFTATDPDNLSDSDAATFTVNAINDAPVIADIPNQTINEGSSFTTINLDTYVSDVDNADSEMTWTYSGNNSLGVSIVNRVATITTPNADWNGAETITFTATDPGNLSDSDAATFTVNSENDPPVVINIPDQTIEEGGNFTTINLDDYVSDADNSDDQISWTHSGNADLIVTITNRVATIMIPDINWNGYETITFTATDPGELADSDTARFTVTAVNDAPVVIALPALSFKEDESLISAKTDWYDFVDDKDNPDSLLIYTLADGKSVKAAVNGNNFVLSSPQDWFGMDTLKFKVTDGELSDSGLVIITVQPVNDAPQLIDMPQTVIIDDTSSFVLNVNDFVIDVDTPENKLTWQFSANNDSLLLDFDDTTSILKISALAIDKDVQVIITVTDDSSASASDTVTVQVNLVSALDELLSMIPVKYTLEQNYPNPFNPTTKIRFGLPKAGDVKIEIYNTGGQRVATLVNGFKIAGFHAISFDASGLASGLYFYRIQAKSFVQVKKMILMK